MLELIVQHWSYLGIMALLILTGCGLPIPEEVPIAMAGVMSAQRTMQPVFAFVSCILGALVGDCVMYAIGYHWGHNLLKDHPRFARLLRAHREAKFEDMIRRHGLKVLFLARFMVGVRSPVYLSAGILRVSFRRFLVMDLMCATAVVSVFFLLSYAFGEQIIHWLRTSQIGLTVILVTVVVGVLVLYFVRRRARSLESDSKCGPPPSEPPVVKDQKRTVA